MLHRKETFVKVSAILLMIATPKLATVLVAGPVLAQASPNVPLPSSSPSGTTTKVDGSSSMTVINETLKKRLEEKFPGTKVELAASGTDEALKALLKGNINLAAVGRPLTSQEKAQGLVAAPIGREKIAIIVGSDNPFKSNLTFEQFAKIFRGEITNWSQVGGPPGAIRFIDRPDASDTRRALSSYKVFKAAKFATGASATRLPQDDTAAVVRELGKNGISYAVVSQVLDQPNVRVLPMHNTLPNDPRYPYSQPRSYVHKANPDPGTLAFLGFLTSSAGQEAVQSAKAAAGETATKPEAPSPSPSAAAVSPSPTASASASPESAVAATESHGGFPWWLWLLPLALLGGLLWWLSRRGHHEPAATNVAPVETDEGTNAALGAAASTGAGAALAGGAALASDNGISPVVPVADAAPVADVGLHETTVPIADAAPVADVGLHETTAPIADAAPVADVGLHETTAPVADAGLGAMGLLGGAVLGGAVLGGAASQAFATGAPSQPLPAPVLEESRSRIVLIPRDSKTAYAYWEVPQAEKDALKQQGGQKLKLRLYDVTDIDINRQHSLVVHQFDCDEREQERQVPIEADNRDYVAELGYVTDDSRWLQLAKSAPVRVPARTVATDVVEAGGTALAGGAVALATGAVAQSLTTADSASETLSDRTSVKSYITLTPRDPRTAYASWEVSQADKDALKQQGGQRLMLRLYDATDINIDQQMPHSIQHFDCDERKQEQQVPIAENDRDYIAELGYVTDDERWLPLTRSAPVRVSALTVPEDVKAGDAPMAGDAAVATGAVAQSLLTADLLKTPSGHTLVGGKSRITLTSRDDKTAYVYWEAPQADKDALKRQGGQKLMLRLYDVTDIDIAREVPRVVQQFDCDEREQERYIPIQVDNLDYVAELGYVTNDGHWLQLATSSPMRILLSRSARGIAKTSGAFATGRNAFAARAGATAQSLMMGDSPVVENKSSVTTGSCAVRHLTVHSKNNCCLLNPEQVRRLQEETAVSKILGPGTYLVRIKSGAFSYGPAPIHKGEPFVLLWIYGGKFINKKTNVAVDATWSSLNGYAETLSLDVLETATLCAFFFDTHVDDNEGEVTISVIQLPLS